MSTTTSIPVYALDPTGTLAANKIVGEPQILTPTNWRNHLFIVPKFAPYFMDSLKLVYRGTDGIVKVMTRGIDWYEGHQYIGASRACAKPIYGSIVFMNNQLEGTVTLEYQTLGGPYCVDEAKIMEILANALYNPRVSSWDAVSGIPNVFPVINHEWDLVDMVGMSDLIASINTIEEQLRQSGQTGLAEHINNTNNPHGVTKEQTGLGLVANYPPANRAQAEAASADNLYLTPQSAKYLVQAVIGNDYATHKAARNPHGTLASDVGTYSATEIDALLGNKLGRSEVAYDSSRFAGMLPADFAAQVLTGTAYNSERFAGRTYLELLQDAQGGASANALQLEGRSLDGVKAYVLESGTAYDASHFGGIAYADFWTAILNSTVANSTQFDGRTYTQFMAELNAGTVNNALRLNGKTEFELTSAILSGTAANAARFGGYNVQEFMALVASSTVANADRIGGMTLNQLVTYVSENASVQNAATVGGMSAQDLKNYTDTAVNTGITNYDITIQDRFATQNAAITSNTDTINGLTDEVAALSAQVTANVDYGSALQDGIDANANSIALLQTQVDTNTTDISALQSAVAAHGTALSSQGDAITANTGSIATLQGSVTSLQSNVSTLQSDVSALETLTASQGTTLSNHTSTLANHTSTLGAHSTSILSHEDRLDTMDTTVAALQNSLAQMNTDVIAAIDALTAQINTIVTNLG